MEAHSSIHPSMGSVFVRDTLGMLKHATRKHWRKAIVSSVWHGPKVTHQSCTRALTLYNLIVLDPPPTVFSKLFMGGAVPPYIADVPPYMVRPHPLYPFYIMEYHLEMPLLSSYLPLSDIYHNCTYQLNSCTIVDCILGLNLARYAHASYTNDTVIHDDVIMNDVISNSTLSEPPY